QAQLVENDAARQQHHERETSISQQIHHRLRAPAALNEPVDPAAAVRLAIALHDHAQPRPELLPEIVLLARRGTQLEKDLIEMRAARMRTNGGLRSELARHQSAQLRETPG